MKRATRGEVDIANNTSTRWKHEDWPIKRGIAALDDVPTMIKVLKGTIEEFLVREERGERERAHLIRD